MRTREGLGFALLLLAALPAGGQDIRREFRPEVDVYVNEGSRARLLFEEIFAKDPGEHRTQDAVACFVEIALRPVFRRELRQAQDVFRKRYLTMRAGYLYRKTFSAGPQSSENRPILELTARYPLPGGFVLADRNRGEFRFMSNSGFSTRYRNRLWLEHDLQFGRLTVTPYVYAEEFFDGRYDAWSQHRLAAGLQFPAGSHVVIEPYLFGQRNTRGSIRRTESLGLKLSLYF